MFHPVPAQPVLTLHAFDRCHHVLLGIDTCAMPLWRTRLGLRQQSGAVRRGAWLDTQA